MKFLTKKCLNSEGTSAGLCKCKKKFILIALFIVSNFFFRNLLQLVKHREKLKREHLQLTVDIFVKR